MADRPSPPGLDALAAAVARYQAQQAEQRRPRTTKEVAIRAGKAASGPAIAIAVAVAISQVMGLLGGGTASGDLATSQEVAQQIAHHDSAQAAHESLRAELDRLRKQIDTCSKDLERLELTIADAPVTPQKARRRGAK